MESTLDAIFRPSSVAVVGASLIAQSSGAIAVDARIRVAGRD